MKTLLLVAALSTAWCSNPGPPTPIDPEPRPPATASCASMCDRMRSLGCEEGEPTEGGASCEMYCENAQASPSPLPVACMTQVRSCEQVPRCTE
jgi:hypothetical protein